jgi:hypothetical protein
MGDQDKPKLPNGDDGLSAGERWQSLSQAERERYTEAEKALGSPGIELSKEAKEAMQSLAKALENYDPKNPPRLDLPSYPDYSAKWMEKYQTSTDKPTKRRPPNKKKRRDLSDSTIQIACGALLAGVVFLVDHFWHNAWMKDAAITAYLGILLWVAWHITRRKWFRDREKAFGAIFICAVIGLGAMLSLGTWLGDNRSLISTSFDVSAPWGFWSKGSDDVSAGWFAYVPDKKVTVGVSVSAYIRVFNDGVRPLWIERCEAAALVSDKWIPLLPMADEHSGEQFYVLAPNSPYGLGWPLPPKLDFGVATETAIPPGQPVGGWVFFAYPTTLGYVSEVKVSVVDRNGARADVLLDTAAHDQTTMHGPEFPPRLGPPSNFRKIPVVHYATLIGR